MAKSKTRTDKPYADMNDRQKKSFLYRVGKHLVKEAGFASVRKWPDNVGKECYISYSDNYISLYKAPDPAYMKCPAFNKKQIARAGDCQHRNDPQECWVSKCRWRQNEADCLDIWIDSPDLVKIGENSKPVYDLSMIDPLFISRLAVIMNYAYDNQIFWRDITGDMCKEAFSALSKSYTPLYWNLKEA